MPDPKINSPLDVLQSALSEQPKNSWLSFALGHRLLDDGKEWKGEFRLLQAAQHGNPHAAAYFAYQKLGLAELEERLHGCASAEEAQSLLHRQTPLQFIEIPSCRRELQSGLHALIVWAASSSPLAQAIDALQCAVAGDRSAIDALKELSTIGQPQARQWLFLLNHQNASGIEEACDWLAPFLNDTWAQRWIGSAFLHRNEPRALEWLWLAARKGDTHSYQLLVNQLKAETDWNDVHFHALAELMQHDSSEAYLLAAHLNSRVFSKLQLHYLKVAHRLGLDTSLDLRHAQSKTVGFTLFTLAAALICILVPELPNFTAIAPLLFGFFRFFRDQQSDVEFLNRFDGVLPNLIESVIESQTIERVVQVVPFETDLFNGDAEAWTKVLGDNELLLDTNPPNLSFWDLNGIRKWNEVWAKLPQMPWHQIWRDVDEEVCILALSGAPAGVFDAAFSELSKANQSRFKNILNRVGYVPLRLCQDAVLTIQRLDNHETLSL